MNIMFKISYGLYVLAANDGKQDNGCMINTFAQQTSSPESFSVTVNKSNLTHDMIDASGKCAVAVLAKDSKFDLIRNFGLQSGKVADKFANIDSTLTKGGIRIPTANVIGYFDLKVEKSVDMGTHTMFVLSKTDSEIFNDAEPLLYGHYQNNIRPKPQPAPSDGKEKWVCRICGYVHEGPLPKDFICPLCKHGANDFERIDNKQSTASAEDIEKIETEKGDKTMAKYVCSVCGYVHEGDAPPAKCPTCGVGADKFIKQESEEMTWAAEHVIGVGQGVPQDIYEGLKANFEGECCEVGMYLAMSRAAHREGYPEIGLYWEKAALEEAEHAAKFCEMLGELVSASTKENLTKRVAAENGATQGKFDLAKRAKEENLDAIHDTVHEMAKDEARHGKAFAGLLARYFG